MTIRTRAIVGLAFFAALGGTAGMTQAQQAQESGRVISSTPIRDSTGQTSYSVTYEYAGRQYTTRTDSPPGRTIALQVSPMGVATLPVPDQPQITNNNSYGNYGTANVQQQPQPQPQLQSQPWANVVPEQGVVVGAGTPPPAVVYGAPAYASAPVYAPAPVYVQPAYGYGYAAPYYVAPPIGVSLNLGYSRGWGGGYGYRGWR